MRIRIKTEDLRLGAKEVHNLTYALHNVSIALGKVDNPDGITQATKTQIAHAGGLINDICITSGDEAKYLTATATLAEYVGGSLANFLTVLLDFPLPTPFPIPAHKTPPHKSGGDKFLGGILGLLSAAAKIDATVGNAVESVTDKALTDIGKGGLGAIKAAGNLGIGIARGINDISDDIAESTLLLANLAIHPGQIAEVAKNLAYAAAHPDQFAKGWINAQTKTAIALWNSGQKMQAIGDLAAHASALLPMFLTPGGAAEAATEGATTAAEAADATSAAADAAGESAEAAQAAAATAKSAALIAKLKAAALWPGKVADFRDPLLVDRLLDRVDADPTLTDAEKVAAKEAIKANADMVKAAVDNGNTANNVGQDHANAGR